MNEIMKYILIIFSILLFPMCTKSKEEKEVRIRPVKHITLYKTGITEEHTFSGVAKSKEEANLSFKVAGTVDQIHVKVGDVIRRGQQIASLESIDYQVSLQQAEAQEQAAQASEQSSETQIKSAEANFISSKSAYQRITKLYENNSVSLSEFEQTKAAYEAAKAQFEAAQSQFEAAQFNTTASVGQKQSAKNQVSYTQLIAPFNGVISQQHKEENELVGSGTAIVTLSSLGKPEVLAGVPEILISKVVKGMVTKVTFTTIPDRVFKAEVIEVGYSPGSGSTYPVTVDLLNTDAAIRPGMPANVTFSFELSGELANRIIVPTASIGEDPNGKYVYKLEKSADNRATVKRHEVEIGKMRNEGFEVISGLKDGDVIAAAGLNILLDGDVVRMQ